eukprot:295414_1
MHGQLSRAEWNFLRIMKNNAYITGRRRYREGKIMGIVGDIDTQFLVQLYIKQNGYCPYGRMKLNLHNQCNWQASLERINTNFGYLMNNVMLIAYEFNHRVQWNQSKISQVEHLVHTSPIITPDDIKTAMVAPKRRSKRVKQQIIDGYLNYYCYGHMMWMPTDLFSSGSRTQCKKCSADNKTLRSFLLHMLSNAKGRAASKRNSGTARGEFNLTLDDICEILDNQNYCCAYSGIPLVFKPHRAWICSIER